jgi:ribosomal subunit interface protein
MSVPDRRRQTGDIVQIEIVGRSFEVDSEVRERIRKRFDRVSRQVSEHSRLEIVLREEPNPAISDKYVAEATLRLKRATLHAEEHSPKMDHSIKALSQDIHRQVKRHRELRRKRSTTRRLVGQIRGREA